jgi:hypothetical protein
VGLEVSKLPGHVARVVKFSSLLSLLNSLFAKRILILELDRTFGGMIQVPSAPHRDALALLGR